MTPLPSWRAALLLALGSLAACNVVVTLDDLSEGGARDATSSSAETSTSVSTGAVGGGGSGAGDGVGGELEVSECEVAADCTDSGSRCIEVTCPSGQCVYEALPNNVPIGSQAIGDCKSIVCSGGGELTINVEDAFDDGNPCTIDACSNGTATNDPTAARTTCTIALTNAEGLCDGDGACVECVDETDCQDSEAPVCQGGVCVPLSCQNLTQDGGETDVDCGGSTACQRCPPGDGCVQASDCAEKVCDGDVCLEPTCGDGVLNQDETGTDCGGGCSQKCGDGVACGLPTDCVSAVCKMGFCATPTCTDGVRNGLETDKDCGGGGCPDCPEGFLCKFDSDCVSNSCQDGRCVSTCGNGKLDAGETDIDCGGPVCRECPDLSRCVCGRDCASNTCCSVEDGEPTVCAKNATYCVGPLTICPE